MARMTAARKLAVSAGSFWVVSPVSISSEPRSV